MSPKAKIRLWTLRSPDSSESHGTYRLGCLGRPSAQTEPLADWETGCASRCRRNHRHSIRERQPAVIIDGNRHRWRRNVVADPDATAIRNVFKKKLVPICAVCPLRQLGSGIFIGSMTGGLSGHRIGPRNTAERRNRSKKKRGKEGRFPHQRTISQAAFLQTETLMEAKRALRAKANSVSRIDCACVTFTPAAVVACVDVLS